MLAMGYKARTMALAFATTSIVVAAGWLVYVVWRSPHRNDLSVFWAFAIPAGVAANAMGFRHLGGFGDLFGSAGFGYGR
jgi:hypothetical protein